MSEIGKKIPSGNVTFLFTDIEGSTKLAQEFPDTLRSALEKHNCILRKAVESNNGIVFKIVGDAFCCAFHNAADAVNAAIDIQTALANEKWDGAVIKIRIGIHSGKVEWNGNDYMGYITLARVARVMSAAFGEQIIISNDAHLLYLESATGGSGTLRRNENDQESLSLRDFDAKEITFRDLGERRLKDVIQPIRLFQVQAKGLREDFPPLKTLDARPNNLPVQLTSFIGRENEMNILKDVLNKTHLLTLTGAGGAGKSRLALQIAANVIDEFANGVWFVELAAISDSSLLANVISDVFKLKEKPNKTSEDILVNYLKNKELLLILDNCEHLIEACSLLSEKLLINCPDLKIIATSREALRSQGEQTHNLLSLKFSDPKEKVSPEELINYESVRLFIERAITVEPSFRLNEDNTQALSEICYKLDGIPLAIELAAARTKILSVEKILQRLNDRFTLLTGGKRTALPRQQTLKALIDWSYDLLTGKEKILWRRLCVFSGGWTLEAAENICSDDDIKDFEVLELLGQLTEKSIIIYENERERYRILESLKYYGEEKLTESDEYENLIKKHLNYYKEMSEEAEPELDGKDVFLWLEKIESDHNNIQTAIYRSINERKNIDEAAILAGSMGRFWDIRGHYSTGKLLLDKILLSGISRSVSGKVLYSNGFLLTKMGDYGTALEHYQKCLEIGGDTVDKNLVAGSLQGMGNVFYLQGKFEKAKKYYNESLEMRKESEDKRGTSNSLYGLGSVAYYQGDYELAKKHFHESLEIRRDIGDNLGVGESINGLGGVAFYQGDFQLAKKYYEECLLINREIGQKAGVAYTLYSLGNVEYNQGNFEKVKEFIEESLSMFRELGDKRGVSLCIYCFAQVALNLKDYKNADENYKESMALNEELGDRGGVAFALNGLGALEFELGNYENSQNYFEKSLEVRKEIGDKRGIAYSFNNLGIIELIYENYDKAEILFTESITLFSEIGEKLGIVESLIGYSKVLIESENFILSVKLSGAIQSAQKSMGIILQQFKQELLDDNLKLLQEKFNEKDFLQYFEEGKKLSPEEASNLIIN